MHKKKLLIGNWKLNHSRASAKDFLDSLKGRLKLEKTDLAIAPVSLMLDFVRPELFGLKLCAQNVFYEEKGAFTGECSAEQLSELGVEYCIVGHSERRTLFFETDEVVAKKTRACLRAKITPVICIGESLAEREAKNTNAVISRQVKAVLNSLPSMVAEEVIFAYEPLWAIGSGKTASLKDIEEVHLLVSELISKVLQNFRILYGGSVSPQNIAEITAIPLVDGVLVGGASLQADSFLAMVEKLQGA